MLKKLKVSFFFWVFILGMVALGMATEMVALLIALTIHESGHLLVAKLLGCRIKKLSVLPLGGYLDLEQLIELEPQTEVRVAVAGPLANLFAVALTLTLGSQIWHSYFLNYFIQVNLTLMAFNLLPALPLDGGRMLRASLAGWLTYYRATKTVIGFSFFCGAMVVALGLVHFFRGGFNPTIIAGGIFLLYNANVEKKQVLVPLFRYALSRQKKLRGLQLMRADTLVAGTGAKVNDVLKYVRPQRYYQISVLDSHSNISGIISEHQLLHQILSGGGQQSLQDVVDKERTD